MRKIITLAFAVVFAFSTIASADEYDLTVKSILELNTQTTDPASGDWIPRFDVSTGEMVKVDASTAAASPSAVDIDSGTIDGTVIGGATPAAGDFTTVGATGAVTIDDGVTDSPALVLQDATNETFSCVKIDAGYVECTTVAGDGLEIVTGNLAVGNGTPGNTLDGEDAYIEGGLEVDGITKMDGNIFISTTQLTADAEELNATSDRSGRIISLDDAETMICTTHSDRILYTSGGTNGNAIYTLPEATGTGCRYPFTIGVIPSASGSNSQVIQVTSDDTIRGSVITSQDGGDTLVMFESAATSDTITLNSQTGAAAIGAHLTLIDVATDQYFVIDAQLIGVGTEASPFSAAVP